MEIKREDLDKILNNICFNFEADGAFDLGLGEQEKRQTYLKLKSQGMKIIEPNYLEEAIKIKKGFNLDHPSNINIKCLCKNYEKVIKQLQEKNK